MSTLVFTWVWPIPGRLYFDKVFNRQDIAGLVIDFRDCRIEAGCFTRTRRTRYQNDAVGR